MASQLRPFTFWLPDNDRLRALGEFEIDEERIKDGYAAGVDKKFYSVYSKYTVSYALNNPAQGGLAGVAQAEGGKYRLHERCERIVEELANRVGIPL